VAESAFAGAELYQRSHRLGGCCRDSRWPRIADLYANRPDDCLVETSKALLLDPKSPRAFNIQGKAWMKADYHKAVDSWSVPRASLGV